MKYILVTGGVISGIGKGVISSSLGTLLKSFGLIVTPIKIDPYINIDAGTFSPYEHGEVFVLDDGGEVDLDLGNYERFLDVKLRRDNNITTGKIYQEVINKERKGDYLGKTVQVVPHITEAIQNWVQRVAHTPDIDGREPDVCIIELGGTVGDIEGMPYIEAFRQFQVRVKRENFINIHVSLVPQPKTTGEQKTKPTQNSVRELRGLGLLPDFVFCRSTTKLTESVREKIAMFCNLEPEQVVSVPDVASVYHVPVMFDDDQIVNLLAERLKLALPLQSTSRVLMTRWREIAERHDSTTKSVTIGLVGKYTQLEDSYLSVSKALQHATLACQLKLDLQFVEADDLEPAKQQSDPAKYHAAWQRVCSAEGILVPGGFGNRGTEGKIAACNWARKNKKPFLGVCLGLQCAVIEFARNQLHWHNANSTEFDPNTKHPVVIEMPEHHTGQMGGTMRLGLRTTLFAKDKESVMRKLYGNVSDVDERHRHRYEVNPDKIKELEAHGMMFVGQDVDGRRMEIVELTGHPYYVGVQYHPEYLSRPLKPSPPYLGLILAASGKLDSYVARGCKFSPRESYMNGCGNGYGYSSEDEDVTSSSAINGHCLVNGCCNMSLTSTPNGKASDVM